LILFRGEIWIGANFSHELRGTLRFIIENYEKCRKEKLKGVGSYIDKFRERKFKKATRAKKNYKRDKHRIERFVQGLWSKENS